MPGIVIINPKRLLEILFSPQIPNYPCKMSWDGGTGIPFSPSLGLVLFIAPTLNLSCHSFQSRDSAQTLCEGAGRCTPALAMSLPQFKLVKCSQIQKKLHTEMS